MTDQEYLDFGKEYWSRFWRFRKIEAEEIPEGGFNSGDAFQLLPNLEQCYAVKAYYACIILSFTMMEIYLKQVEGHTGRAVEMIRSANLTAEIDWLRKLRNDIAHGNANELVRYHFVDAKKEAELEECCLRAFRILHALPKRMQ